MRFSQIRTTASVVRSFLRAKQLTTVLTSPPWFFLGIGRGQCAATLSGRCCQNTHRDIASPRAFGGTAKNGATCTGPTKNELTPSVSHNSETVRARHSADGPREESARSAILVICHVHMSTRAADSESGCKIHSRLYLVALSNQRVCEPSILFWKMISRIPV